MRVTPQMDHTLVCALPYPVRVMAHKDWSIWPALVPHHVIDRRKEVFVFVDVLVVVTAAKVDVLANEGSPVTRYIPVPSKGEITKEVQSVRFFDVFVDCLRDRLVHLVNAVEVPEALRPVTYCRPRDVRVTKMEI